ncbi:alpha/beta fold hydrolase [Streptomyces sp. M19]
MSGGEVATEVRGDGPAVVLVHGTPASSYLWREVAPVLAERYTVHVWDMLGFGDSAAPPASPVHRAPGPYAGRTRRALGSGRARPGRARHRRGVVMRAHLTDGLAARGVALLDAAVIGPWNTRSPSTCSATPRSTARCRRTSSPTSSRRASAPPRTARCRTRWPPRISRPGRARRGSTAGWTRSRRSASRTPATRCASWAGSPSPRWCSGASGTAGFPPWATS